jgi:hypothetical protein
MEGRCQVSSSVVGNAKRPVDKVIVTGNVWQDGYIRRSRMEERSICFQLRSHLSLAQKIAKGNWESIGRVVLMVLREKRPSVTTGPLETALATIEQKALRQKKSVYVCDFRVRKNGLIEKLNPFEASLIRCPVIIEYRVKHDYMYVSPYFSFTGLLSSSRSTGSRLYDNRRRPHSGTVSQSRQTVFELAEARPVDVPSTSSLPMSAPKHIHCSTVPVTSIPRNGKELTTNRIPQITRPLAAINRYGLSNNGGYVNFIEPE